MKLPVTLLSFVLIISECNLQEFGGRNSDADLSTIQILRKYGYPAETHVVKTADGYILEMHRIPHDSTDDAKRDAENRKKFPVLLQHGILGSSADFVLLGPGKGLAFLLADLGFDVWMGNLRGNTYSRAHVSLSPEDKQFWDFSWNESGMYDLPAEIDYITNHTKTEKIIYVAHSMGTTTFFVMTSTLPEYNDRIELSLLMAPVAYVKNLKSPLLRGLVPMAKTFKILDDLIAHGEFLPHSPLIQVFGELFCFLNKVEERLCEDILFLVTGADPKEFPENLLPIFLGHFPSGYSIKGVYHYAQLVQSGAFREYDYGQKRNEEHYHRPTPPHYNVSSITAKMNFYIGQNDYLATTTDNKHLAKELHTLEKFYVVDYSKFSHIDFLIAKDVKELLYDVMIKDIQTHLNKQ